MSDEEFDGPDFNFAVGEIYGVRRWRLIEGLLYPLHICPAQPWTPGVNEARCEAEIPPVEKMPQLVVDPTHRRRTAIEVHTAQVTCNIPGVHDTIVWTVQWDDEGPIELYSHIAFRPYLHGSVPDENCRCGFYAYNDPQHPEVTSVMNAPTVTGIISGFGRTLIGTKGFRCSKAEIVALLDRGDDLLFDNYPGVARVSTMADLVGYADLGSEV